MSHALWYFYASCGSQHRVLNDPGSYTVSVSRTWCVGSAGQSSGLRLRNRGEFDFKESDLEDCVWLVQGGAVLSWTLSSGSRLVIGEFRTEESLRRASVLERLKRFGCAGWMRE